MDPAHGTFAHLTFSFRCLAANVTLQDFFQLQNYLGQSFLKSRVVANQQSGCENVKWNIFILAIGKSPADVDRKYFLIEF